MDYKLAKKLKDAGFPQGKECDEKGFCSNSGSWIAEGADNKTTKELVEIDFNWKRENYIYIPILEELIEWCGDKLVLWIFEKKWYCGTIEDDLGEKSDRYLDATIYDACKGETIEEAVAKLGLELNKK